MPSLLPPVEKIAILLILLFTLLNSFLKTKLYSDKFHIISCDIKFYVSLFQKIVKKNFVFYNEEKTTFE